MYANTAAASPLPPEPKPIYSILPGRHGTMTLAGRPTPTPPKSKDRRVLI